MSSFAEFAQEFETEWQADLKGAGVLPDGDHEAELVTCRVERTTDGRWTWLMVFRNEGGSVRDWNNLDHEVGRRIAAEKAAKMQLDIESFADLEAAGEGAVGQVYRITVETKPGDTRDFTNVYMRGHVGVGGQYAQEEKSEQASKLADDDIPF